MRLLVLRLLSADGHLFLRLESMIATASSPPGTSRRRSSALGLSSNNSRFFSDFIVGLLDHLMCVLLFLLRLRLFFDLLLLRLLLRLLRRRLHFLGVLLLDSRLLGVTGELRRSLSEPEAFYLFCAGLVSVVHGSSSSLPPAPSVEVGIVSPRVQLVEHTLDVCELPLPRLFLSQLRFILLEVLRRFVRIGLELLDAEPEGDGERIALEVGELVHNFDVQHVAVKFDRLLEI